MKHHIQTTKNYVTTHKKQLVTSTTVVFIVIALITAITLFIQNNTPKVIYQPAKACDLFSFAEAQKLLGNKTLTSIVQNPAQSNDLATSKCGYTDGNPDMNAAVVAAIMVRSGINDKGIEQNKSEFTAGKPAEDVEAVKDLGNDAYFNQKLGQLNVLDDKKWVILSYGIGSTPEANTVEKAVELAKIILR